jgi:hypothetical protein
VSSSLIRIIPNFIYRCSLLYSSLGSLHMRNLLFSYSQSMLRRGRDDLRDLATEFPLNSVGSSIQIVNTPCVTKLKYTQRAIQLHTLLYQESQWTCHTHTVQTRCVNVYSLCNTPRWRYTLLSLPTSDSNILNSLIFCHDFRHFNACNNSGPMRL